MSLQTEDLRRLWEGVVENTEVEEDAEVSGERGESVRGGVSVSFLRSGSKGELAGEGVWSC